MASLRSRLQGDTQLPYTDPIQRHFVPVFQIFLVGLITCQTHLPERYHLKIVDISDDPLQAVKDKVLVTPKLVKTAPYWLFRS